ncbi:hypothetical protein G7092_24555 [Mucilaginibacter sp. HC2]|uniref:hypothetical protein n=1 Tax=Mucilaginibacter inviolabilis TaxID=2714892 RepID=UPI00140851E4|nr:hypothetical protein [Mucilaginibacter inviolabilis]NHA06994.1 hypothetical protein [Mucilaginibacter inviolabilis]
MKLFSLILFAVLLTGYNSYAQNYFPATGNVGIGTTNPYGPLNVDPQGTGGITIGNPSVNSGGFTSLQMGISAVQNGYSFLQGVQASGGTWGNIILNRSGGNIGIGITTADEKLVVNGNIKTLLESTYYPAKNVATIKQLGLSGATGAMNWTLRGVYQYPNGVLGNADGGDLDIIKALNGNTILGTKTDGTALGNVGIGIVTPKTKLSVQGTGTMSNLNSPAIADLFGVNDRSRLTIGNSTTTAGGTRSSAIAFYGMNATGNAYKGNWEIGNDLSLAGKNDFYFYSADLNSVPLYINPVGNVGIGITNPQNKLDVNGTIHSKAVNIDLNGWNDYVFKKDYQLRPLSEVKAYIDQNQHLPEIPSEQEMVKKGLDVGEMNKLLMKKVEELTLYLIEKDQQVKEQNKRIDDQQKQINKLIEAGHK